MTISDILNGIKSLGTKAASTVGNLLSSAKNKTGQTAGTIGDMLAKASSPVEGNAADTKTGIAINTVAGLPKAAVDVAKDIAKGAVRFAYSAGEAIPELPVEVYDAATGKNTIKTYQPEKVPGLGFLGPVESYQNEARRRGQEGESTLGSIFKTGGQAVLDEPTGAALKPLAILGHAAGPLMAGFLKEGGGKAVEEAIDTIAKTTDPEEIKGLLKGLLSLLS